MKDLLIFIFGAICGGTFLMIVAAVINKHFVKQTDTEDEENE